MSHRLPLALCFGLASLAGCPMPGGEMPSDPSSTDPVTVGNPPPQGNWTCATSADAARAGFQTLDLLGNGTWSETERSDDQLPMGKWSQPGDPGVDESYGDPPAGMHGPYILVSNEPDGDGAWVYGWSETTDHASLSLTLYAARGGMGLRWAQPTTIALSAK